MRDFDTQEEWGEFLSQFNEGVIATFVPTKEQVAAAEAVQALAERVHLDRFEDDIAHCVIVDASSGAVFRAAIEGVEEEGENRVCLRTTNDQFVFLSKNLSEAQREALKPSEEGEWWE